MNKNATVIKYKPSYVRLPENIKKDFSQTKWKDQLENKEQQPTYDDYSLFYDVFFDIDKNNIWTIGPPLFSVEDEMLPFEIFYQGKKLTYKYSSVEYKTVKYPYFQIPATRIKEENPELTFTGKDWTISIKVSTFPTSNHQQPTLTLLQKDYSIQHIIEWILWHYRLYGFKRILFYDNGSNNAAEVQKALENLQIPDLEIIFIEWHYFYGSSERYDDLFAQTTQLNHTLKLHHQQNTMIGDWDLDEYLVSAPNNNLQKIINRSFYYEMKRYQIVDVGQELPTSVKDCLIRKIQPQQGCKYFFRAKNAKHIGNPHVIAKNNFILFYHLSLVLKARLLKPATKIFNRSLPSNSDSHGIYLIHAEPIKRTWKVSQTNKDRPFRTTYDAKIHIKDENIANNIKQSGL
ncbi:MAG: hypothetical protein HFP81_09940 [Methylococcales symbiont of Hymedesmia sp. n. MRB-2018]|nr:MAG: hypothetical protein HFP81_09940 [Methylococcales symbiont of Hymedesmia sp. n. MRB-2018]